jgi:hypothetical protein
MWVLTCIIDVEGGCGRVTCVLDVIFCFVRIPALAALGKCTERRLASMKGIAAELTMILLEGIRHTSGFVKCDLTGCG